jgi:hypothetical protein
MLAEWVAIGVTLLLTLGGIVKRYGSDETRMSNIEKEQARSFKYHDEHFKHALDDQAHFQDTEMHWTSRERDELNRKLDAIHTDLKTLTERMYGK